MASIQQSLNQMLMSAQLGAGFYAHSPAGKRMAQVRDIETEQKVLTERALVEGEGDISPKNYKKLGELEEKKFDLTGKEKYFNKAIKYYEHEVEAEESLKRRAMEKLNQQTALKERLTKLEGGIENGEQE